MKKSLSLLLSGAMVVGSFASVAFAADTTTTAPTTTAAPTAPTAPTAPATPPTTQQMYDALAAKQIFSGVNANGDAGLDQKMTRAQFARAAALVRGLEGIGNPDTLVVTSAPFKDVPVGKWFTEEVQAVKAAGIMIGNANGTFNPNGNITVQELAVVSAQLLGLKPVDGSTVAGAASWAAGYIKALTDNGVTFPTNYKETATRAQLVGVAYQAYAAVQAAKLQPVSAKVIDANNVEVTFTDKLVEKVVLKDALVANKETEITVTHLGKDYKYKVTYVVTSATKVESVSASNLKEVVVKFDGDVDPATAGDTDNYTIKGGTTYSNPVVDGASLSDDKKSVTLNVHYNGTVALSNQVEYKLDVRNIKAGDKVISTTDYKFTPVDAAIPTAVSATALGNQTVKVVFSEPVLPSTAVTSFKIDGNTFGGSVQASGSNTVVVKSYTKLTDGAHKVSVAGVSDYSGLKSLSQDFDLTVTADNTAPTIASVVSASFEKVTLKFSEPIDSSTIAAGNVYWLQGASKKTATTFDAVSDDTYNFYFTGYPLQYTTDVYVAGVRDFSGNSIAADSKIAVTPTVDVARPEVSTVDYDASTGKFTIKFNKTLDLTSAQNASNYVIKNKDGVEVSKYKTVVRDSADNKKVTVTLGTKLGEGSTYTLSLSGVSDNTVLKNVMLPYSKTITVSDATAPTVTNPAIKDTTLNRLFVTFSEPMALSGDGSAIDKSKYMYSNGTTWSKLPDSASLNIQGDLKTVIISIPTTDLNVSTVQKLRVNLVQDVAGNYLAGYTADIDVGPGGPISIKTSGVQAKATSTNTIELYVSRALLSNTFNLADFSVIAGGSTPLNLVSGSIDGTTVTLNLADSNKLNENATFGLTGLTVDVTVRAGATTSTPDGVPLAQGTTSASNVDDGIAATVASVLGSTYGDKVLVTFNEDLAAGTVDDSTTVAGDFLVKDKDGNTLTQGADYKVTTDATLRTKVATINFMPGHYQSGVVTVQVVNPRFLKDWAGNVVAASDELQVLNDVALNASIPAATNVTTNDSTHLVLTFSNPLYQGTTPTAIANNTDLVGKFDVTGTAVINSALYNSATNTVTISFSTVGDGNTVKAKSGVLEAFNGAAYAPETITYHTTNTVWTK